MPSGWEDFVHTETLTFPCQCIAEDPPLAQSSAMPNFLVQDFKQILSQNVSVEHISLLSITRSGLSIFPKLVF